MSLEQPKPTLRMAIEDLGYVSGLFTLLVGAPSVMTLMQAALNLEFSVFVQWLVDGYNEVLSALALILDPLVIQFVVWARAFLDLDVALQPHWRPLFVLALIFVSANTRTIWGDGYKGPAAIYAVVSAVCALVACLVSGVIPDDAPAWLHGLAAGQFVFLIFFGLTASYAIASLFFAFAPPYRQPLQRYLLRGAVLALAAFLIAFGLSISAAPVARPGLATAFGGMFLYGAYWLYYGFAQQVFPEIRFGLRMVGGYAFAMLVVLVDAILR